MSRFSSVMAHLAVVGGLVAATAAVAAPPAAPPPGAAVRQEVRDDWDYQYRRLGAPYGKLKDDCEVAEDGIHLLQNEANAPVDRPYLLDRQAAIWPEDRDQADVVLRRTKALLAHLKAAHPALAVWGPLQSRLDGLAAQAAKTAPDRTGAEAARMAVYRDLCALRRAIALANPLLDFDEVLFAEICHAGIGCSRVLEHPHGTWTNDGAARGGGLYVLKNWKTGNPRRVNLVEKATPADGPYRGRDLSQGVFYAPSLSYDGRTVYFSWADPSAEPDLYRNTKPGRYAHIFRINLDGSDLRQLTFGPYDDLDPCEMPDGRIVFTSTRRESYDRCGQHPNPISTFLHLMKPDGSDIVCLSFHETHELEPGIDNDGMIVYSRWDYVDRKTRAPTNFWRCAPDGRDPRAPHGNYYFPLFDVAKTFAAGPYRPASGFAAFTRKAGPRWMQTPESEVAIRAIPGTSGKYTALANSGGGARSAGLVGIGIPILIDLARPDDYQHSQITHITQDTDTTYLWGSPWPLSEDFYLINYLDRLYLLDRFGNRELIHHMKSARDLSATRNMIHESDALAKYNQVRAKDGLPPVEKMPLAEYTGKKLSWRPFHPMPVKARPRPPVLPTLTYQSADRRGLPDHRPATLAVMNVYETDVPLPPNVKVKWLRLVQALNVTSGCYQVVQPGAGLGRTLLRLPLGVVPVEEDGSVYCQAPIERGLYFQLLDENGLAIQSMLSLTYVHPGEQLTCVGCHEPYGRSPGTPTNAPLAMRRAPSVIQPEFPEGVVPPDFQRQIKPIFDRTCAACHAKESKAPKTVEPKMSDYNGGGLFADGKKLPWIPYHEHNGAARTMPGHVGATGSLLWQHVQKHRAAFTKDELKRLAWWIDLCCPLSGIYGNFYTEIGGIRWPTRPDVDPENPLGVERLPEPVTAAPITARAAWR